MHPVFNTKTQYGKWTKFMHWFTGLLIILMTILGLLMTHMSTEPHTKSTLYFLHKSIGLLILPLAIIWFFSWIIQNKPERLKDEKKSLHRISKMTQTILISCALLMPFSGWMMSSAFSQTDIMFFNIIKIPRIVSYDPAFARAMLGLHILISWFIIGFSSLHITAALWHHFIKKDIILQRMLPFGRNTRLIKKKKNSNIHHLGRK